MATKETCEFYGECQFVEWRKTVNIGQPPLPKNGDCGIRLEQCLRINPASDIVTIKDFGPSTDSELKVVYPNPKKD